MSEKAETAIDAAWRAAQDAHAGDDVAVEADRTRDTAAARFIDALLVEPLYCPVWDSEQASEEAISPKMIERDGRDVLVLFDSDARLAAFAKEPTEYVALPGAAFFKLAAGQDVPIALNPEVASSSALFAPETVDAIAELAEAVEEEMGDGGDAPLTILPPEDAPEPLLRALLARLAAARAVVSEAWLFTAVHEADDVEKDEATRGRDLDAPEERRQLVIGLRAQEPRTPSEIQSLVAELGRIGAAAAPGAFAVALFESDDKLLRVARDIGRDLGGEASRAA